MSSISRWAYTAKATVWRVASDDEYGAKVFYPPEIIYCDYGGDISKKIGAIGIGFAVKNTFYTEYDVANNGDYILLGESSAADPVSAGADEIKHIIRYADTFDRASDDFGLITAV